jgi:hypothetical protein
MPRQVIHYALGHIFQRKLAPDVSLVWLLKRNTLTPPLPGRNTP